MDTSKAIVFGCALIGLAIIAKDIARPANAGFMGSGRYIGTPTGSTSAIWVVDTETGAVRKCNLRNGCGEWMEG
jgi:hypothetical protein